MNMLFRSLVGVQHKKIHIIAVGIVSIGVFVGLIGASISNTEPSELVYSMMFLGCGVMLALSHNLKEGIIRKHPFDMINLNFRVSVA
jgi:drug/metabolite transporter (DMT)-like permease